MSVLINLLPDIRQAKLREHRRRQLISGIAVVIWAVCGGLILVLGIYSAGQKAFIASYTNGIADKKKQLDKIPGLVDALTAQEHLVSLPGLYDQRIYMTKFFEAYQQSSPQDVKLSSLSVGAANELTVSGTATSYAAVSKLARALDAANISVGPGSSSTNQPYFKDTTIKSVSNDNKNTVSFSITTMVESGATSGDNE